MEKMSLKFHPKNLKCGGVNTHPPLIRSNVICSELADMVNYFIETKTFKNASGYWIYLCMSHIKLLVENGVENFKQTIEKKHYWGEASLESTIIKPIINN